MIKAKRALALVLAAVFLLPTLETAAHAGCQITLKGRNDSSNDRVVQVRWERSQVRNRLGTWRGFPVPPWATSSTLHLGPHESFSRVWTFDFGCNVDRRYRFRLVQWTAEHVYYYPSESAFTREVVINLWDLNRFFQ